MTLLEFVIKITLQGQQAAAGLARINRASQSAAAGMNATGASATSLSQRLRSVSHASREFAVAVALPVGLALTKMYRVSRDVQGALTDLEIAAGDSATPEKMAALRQEIERLADDPQIRALPTRTAILAKEMVKAGLSIDKVHTSLGAVLALNAAAGSGPLDPGAAEDMAKSMAKLDAQFGIFSGTPEEAKRSLELMAGAVNTSTLNLQDMVEVLGTAGGSAAIAGMDFKQFLTSASIITNFTTSARDAGTSLKTFIARLPGQTKKAKAALEKLNINFFDAKGNSKSATEIASVLEDATKQMNKKEQIDFFHTIFGSDAGRAGAAFTKEGFIGVAKAMKDIERANMSEMLKKRATTAASAEERIAAAFERLSMAVMSPEVLDAIAQAMGTLADGFIWLAEAAKAHPEIAKWAVVLLAVLAAAGPVLFVVSNLARGLIDFVKFVGFAWKVLGFLGTALRIVGTVFMWLGRLMLANPILAIIAAIALAAYYIWSNWDWIGPKFWALWESIKDAAMVVWGALMSYFGWVWDTIKGLFAAGSALLRGDWSGMWEAMSGVATTFIDGIIAAVEKLFGLVVKAWDKMKAFGSWLSDNPTMAASILGGPAGLLGAAGAAAFATGGGGKPAGPQVTNITNNRITGVDTKKALTYTDKSVKKNGAAANSRR